MATRKIGIQRFLLDKKLFLKAVVFVFSCFCVFMFAPLAYAETPADVQNLIEVRQQQIAEIEQQIADYWKAVDDKKSQGQSVGAEVDALKEKIRISELEIRGLNLAVEESRYKLKRTESEIGKVQGNLDKTVLRLASSLRSMFYREDTSTLLRLAQEDKISGIFIALGELSQLHESLKGELSDLKDIKTALEETKESIQEEKISQEKLRNLESYQKEMIEKKKLEKTKLVQQLEKEKNKIIGKIAVKKQDLEKIREQITYLGKVGVTAEEAVRYGELAAIRTGVRTAFLIAVLEVESRLGLNVGKGTWKADMSPKQFDAFISVTSKLGLDPDKTPVSKAPSYGWGGAMGPAQFLPATWLAYEAEVVKLTGHNPANPWNIEDAFTAAALKLARGGAAEGTRDGEIRAARAYIGGSPNCSRSICNSYANMVQGKASEIEAELNKNK